MLALLSVWIGLVTLILAAAMVVYRPAFNDTTVMLVLWFGAPGAMCFALLTLWAFRKDRAPDTGVVARRLQCKVAVVMSLAAAAIVYGLVMCAPTVPAGLQ